MVPIINQGAIEAIISGFFAGLASFAGKLAFDHESVVIVEKLCQEVIDFGTPILSLGVWSFYEVSKRNLFCFLLLWCLYQPIML